MNRVLIVDDALELGRLLRAAISTLDSSISTGVVPSAEEALLDASRYPPALLVADFRLPGMTGFELITKIRTRLPDIKVIVITGQKDPQLQTQAEGMGVDAFFRKPMEMSAFLDAVSRCLNLRRSLAAMPAEVPGEAGSRTAVTHTPVAEVLIRFRQKLDVPAVLLWNNLGHLTAQAGGSPVIPRLTDSNGMIWEVLLAGNRLCRELGSTGTDEWMAFSTGQFDLVITLVAEHVVGVLLPPSTPAPRMALVLEQLRPLQKDLAAAFSQLEEKPLEVESVVAPVQLPGLVLPEQPAVVEEDPAALHALETLFGQAGQAKPEEVDSFWSSPEANKQLDPQKPDVLTYEQARQLGLAPHVDGDA